MIFLANFEVGVIARIALSPKYTLVPSLCTLRWERLNTYFKPIFRNATVLIVRRSNANAKFVKSAAISPENARLAAPHHHQS